MLTMTCDKKDVKFMSEAIRLSEIGMDTDNGGPFGAVVVKDGEIIGKGYNKVLSTNDPTAHAEIVAIRDASEKTGSFDLSGCFIYVSCEPCPMCLSAIYWANIDRIYYANTKEDARYIGFRDAFIYEEIAKPLKDRQKPFLQISRDEANRVFEKWKNRPGRIEY